MQKADIGLIGLGVMGRNLVLNMAEHGFAVAGYDKDVGKVASLKAESKMLPVYAALTIGDFISSLKSPRIIMLLVPAGKPVDAVIADIVPFMSAEDIIIDGGNSHFTDTDSRAQKLAAKKIMYLGVGVSGGEAGARHGPSIMPGGKTHIRGHSGKGGRRRLCGIHRSRLCGAFRQNGAQRHRIRRYAIDLRDVSIDEGRAGDEQRRDA
jgi:6-phosphogluconate dehydrogenase